MIIVCVRTRDEEHRIADFCRAYEDADMILVGDGGSVDNTVEIAKSFPNVIVRHYYKKVFLKGGYWRNNDSDHANWMFEWAREYEPDWIIYDDCDCRPNYLLKNRYRQKLSESNNEIVMVVRFYVWGTNQHFPHMAKPEKKHRYYETSLWAIRGDLDFWTVDVPPAYTFRIGDMHIKDFHEDTNVLDLLPPYALIHYSWDDEERVMEKIKIYRESGLIPNQLHPLHFAGPLELKPEFLHE